MSSEWGSVLAVFWTLYLVDGLRGGRRDRLFFHAWHGAIRGSQPEETGVAAGCPTSNGRRGKVPPASSAQKARRPVHSFRFTAHVTQASWFLPPPAPFAWTLPVDDLPASLAPEGLTNWPSGSASRPPPLPEAVVTLRWEDIKDLKERSGWIFINGSRFAPATPGLTAAELSKLWRELLPLSPCKRAQRLTNWQRARFSTTPLRRRVRVALGRSAGLAALNTAVAGVLLALTAYLLLDGPSRVPTHWRDQLGQTLPTLLAASALLHVASCAWFWSLHRRLFPRAGQDRASLLFTAILVPPQALRLRQHLVVRLGSHLHPLALALVCAAPQVATAIARDTLRDLRWPKIPSGLPSETAELVRASGRLVEPIVHECLTAQGPLFDPEALLVAPNRSSPEICAYCPRCGDTFTGDTQRCPHGVVLTRY